MIADLRQPRTRLLAGFELANFMSENGLRQTVATSHRTSHWFELFV